MHACRRTASLLSSRSTAGKAATQQHLVLTPAPAPPRPTLVPSLPQIVLTEDGSAARLVAKYRPPCPVIVVSPNARALRSLAVTFGLYPMLVRALLRRHQGLGGHGDHRVPAGAYSCADGHAISTPLGALCCSVLVKHGQTLVISPVPCAGRCIHQVDSFAKDTSRSVGDAINYALAQGLAVDGIKVLTVTGGPDVAAADESPLLTSQHLGECTAAPFQRLPGNEGKGWQCSYREVRVPECMRLPMCGISRVLTHIPRPRCRTFPSKGMRSMSFLQRDPSRLTMYVSPFAASTTYCNQDVHIGVDVGGRAQGYWGWQSGPAPVPGQDSSRGCCSSLKGAG
jgi:hypothetical protein